MECHFELSLDNSFDLENIVSVDRKTHQSKQRWTEQTIDDQIADMAKVLSRIQAKVRSTAVEMYRLIRFKPVSTER